LGTRPDRGNLTISRMVKPDLGVRKISYGRNEGLHDGLLDSSSSKSPARDARTNVFESVTAVVKIYLLGDMYYLMISTSDCPRLSGSSMMDERRDRKEGSAIFVWLECDKM
jgi:hypothetical protein